MQEQPRLMFAFDKSFGSSIFGFSSSLFSLLKQMTLVFHARLEKPDYCGEILRLYNYRSQTVLIFYISINSFFFLANAKLLTIVFLRNFYTMDVIIV